VRALRVEMFSTIDGYGGGDGPTGDGPGYFGYGTPGMIEWMQGELAEEQVLLMGATTYRQMSEVVTNGDDPTFSRMTELPKIVFSQTVKPPLMWANTTIVDEPVETTVPELKAIADGVPMRTLGSRSLVGSLVRLGLVDRIRVLVFPTIWAATGAEPVFSELPDIDLTLAGTTVIDEKIVLLDYRVPGA
jgi:dihydrofolate reductase